MWGLGPHIGVWQVHVGTRSPQPWMTVGTRSPQQRVSVGTRSPHKCACVGTRSPHRGLVGACGD